MGVGPSCAAEIVAGGVDVLGRAGGTPLSQEVVRTTRTMVVKKTSLWFSTLWMMCLLSKAGQISWLTTVQPPLELYHSSGITSPVMYIDSSEARKMHTPIWSSGWSISSLFSRI